MPIFPSVIPIITMEVVSWWWCWLASLPEKCKSKVVDYAKKTKMVAQEDPRTIVHSIKVALALTLVSLFYYLRPLYDGMGVSAMSAILTVVLLFEFTAGATLAKVINRGVATILACAFGVGVHYITSYTGDKGEPILLGFIVFIISTTLSLVRFFPRIKQKYDNGVLVFMMTFISVSLSGYRVHKILEITYHRLFTIVIGSAICVIVSILICPVWAGEDLHNLVALNMEMIGTFLQEFGSKCTKTEEEIENAVEISKVSKSFLQECNAVFDSSSIEESMAIFAAWEPGHGAFRYSHPWKKYVEVGNLLRKCAYHAEALHYYYTNSKIHASPYSNSNIQETCAELSSDCGKALNMLALSMRTMTRPSSTNLNVLKSTTIAGKLKITLKTSLLENIDIMEVIYDTTVASILGQIISCTEEIVVSVQELAQLAHFSIAGTMI